ncbi:MAG: sodium:calcium antiporter, partial [Cyanobacteriota bacterium]
SCIPTSVGILLTPWVLGLKELVSVASVLVSIILLYFLISLHKNILKPWMLIVCGAFYFIYFLYVFIV